MVTERPFPNMDTSPPERTCGACLETAHGHDSQRFQILQHPVIARIGCIQCILPVHKEFPTGP